MRTCIRWLDMWAEEVVVSIMLTLLVAMLGMEVFSRFLLGRSFPVVEELSRYTFIWSCYLGIVIAIKRKEQIRVLMFVDQLAKYSPRLYTFCYVASELISVGFCLTVFYYSLSLLENMSLFKQTSGALQIDVKYAYYIIPLSMGLASLRTLQGLYRDYVNGTLRFINREDS